MATEVRVPALGESVTSAILVLWHKQDGDTVKVDDPLCELETDKANVDVPAPVAGVLRTTVVKDQQVAVGEVIARIDPVGAAAPAPSAPLQAPAAGENNATREIPSAAASSSADEAGARQPAAARQQGGGGGATSTAPGDLSPAVRRVVAEHNIDTAAVQGTGPGGRITKEDVVAIAQRDNGGHAGGTAPAPAKPTPVPAEQKPSPLGDVRASAAPNPTSAVQAAADGTKRVPMSKIRRRIAETLVKAQQTAAILTTFNEIDMTAVMDLRTKFKDRFAEVHGVGLGFMSFFARAVVLGLRELPHLNAFIDGTDIVYNEAVHLGIAVSTERGLAVPVLRNVQNMSFARVESEIKRLAAATKDGKLGLEEITGGTFSITNGGVFGSLMSTPILNPPQSGILGMHAIQKRPVAINDKVEIRPMMYVALSYDHRIVDGREAITFLVRLKQFIEDPARLMLEI